MIQARCRGLHNPLRGYRIMNFKEKRQRSVGIDITPIVDTVFNLLIFFALSLNFTATTALDITLPSLAAPERSTERTALQVEITRRGDLRCNGAPVTLPELERIISIQQKTDEGMSVIIHADDQATHGLVVRVMDVCKRCGCKKISIAADVAS